MTKNFRLHHVGFVVAEIKAAIPGFLNSMQAEWDERVFEDPLQQVKVAFMSVRHGDALIELVEPVGDRSPVLRFLNERGGGLHHLCYEVPDIEKSLAESRERGLAIVSRPKPAVAFNGRRIAWVLTRENMLVEFLEASS